MKLIALIICFVFMSNNRVTEPLAASQHPADFEVLLKSLAWLPLLREDGSYSSSHPIIAALSTSTNKRQAATLQPLVRRGVIL